MTKTFWIIVSISLVMLISNRIYSQRFTGFTPDPDKFIKELDDQFSQTSRAKEGKQLVALFKEKWEEGNFTEDQKKRVYKTVNMMIKERALMYPHIAHYLEILLTFETGVKDLEFYNNWEAVLRSMLETKKITIRKVDDYLVQTGKLVSGNVIFHTKALEWRANSDEYKLKIENNQVKVIFENKIDLVCEAVKIEVPGYPREPDTLRISGTNGIFYLFEKKWLGVNGKIGWERAGFKPDEVFAYLKTYEIDMNKTRYKADSVEFVNVHYFDKPLLGTLEDKIITTSDPDKATYPKFDSYTNRFFIEDIFPDVDYDGGFRMKGANFIGASNDESFVTMNFYRKDTLFITAQSKTFIFKQNQVVGNNSIITMRLDTDSIYHPGLIFKYLLDKRQVVLFRDNKGMSRSPFFNTYHKVDIDVAMVTWKMDEPRVVFTVLMGTTDKLAIFESNDFFTEQRYNDLQMMDDINPLYSVKNFTRQIKRDQFTDVEFTKYMRKSITEVRRVLMNLSYMGFLYYNFEKGEVVVLQRLHDYLNSYVGKKDYDVISFLSEPDTAKNATLNLLNYDLSINGVQSIQLSDSQQVILYPEDKSILLKKNRDFEFDGVVEAGLFTFYGSDFSFEYDKFKINLVNVHKLKLKVRTGEIDGYGMPILRQVKTDIEQVTGDLLIDHPNNKSGMKKFPEFPIFNSRSDSYVYYDKGNEFNEVYPRDNFYFQIYPYTIDSLDNFDKDAIDLKGYFVSAGIFPPFEESLTLQPDYSLGFRRKTPDGGLPLYGGKGAFVADISLSNRGLRGDGQFDYVASTTYSKDFMFFPDSMNTTADIFKIKKQESPVPFPQVMGDGTFIHWMPYEDYLLADMVTSPIRMFEEQAIINGTLKVTPEGLTGWGRMEFSSAELTSNLFQYGENTIDADTSRFNMKSFDMDDFTFKTENVNAHIDFVERKGVFKSNGEASFVEFPQNQYICFMDQFNWYMDKEEIEMSASRKALDSQKPDSVLSPMEREDIQLSGSQFISIHPRQDSLTFMAPSAKYSLRKNIIKAKEVKYIRIGDATCYLDEKGEVTIEKKAKMRTLNDTRILANNTSRFHNIYNATTNIYGRKDYSSSGDYDYIDQAKQTQKIHFDLVKLDSTLETYATGKIGMTEKFKLSPFYDYTGGVTLHASNKNLTFKGATRLVHECDTLYKYWVNFESEIDPNEIYIPFYSDSTTDINDNKLYAGYYVTNDSSHIYSAFLTKRGKYSDSPLMQLDGYLFYDTKAGKYIISNKEKIVEPNMPGDYLSLHKTICNQYGEGKVGLGVDLGRIEMTSVGNINNSLDDNYYALDLLLGTNFYFNEKCLGILAETITEASGLEGADLSRKTFKKGLAEIVGLEESENLLAELALGTMKKIPKELQYTIFFNELKFNWDSKTRAYTSVGDIGISSIGKTQINRKVEGIIQVVKKRSGDILHMYLKIDDATWFYFVYRATLMQAYSSIPEFVTILQETKLDDRRQENEKGQMRYVYQAGAKNGLRMFLKQFEEGADDYDEDDDDDSED